MKKLAYISPESFLDVDFPIIKEINKHFDLLWIITFSSKTNDKYRFYFPGDVISYCKENSIRYIITQSDLRSRDIKRLKFNYSEIIKPAKEFNPDILYFESFYDPYLPILAKIFFKSKKVIIGLHDVVPHSGVTSVFHKLSQKIIIDGFRNFQVFSDSQQTLLNKIKPKNNSFVIPLYLKSFGKSPGMDLSGNRSKVTFLFFGRIYPYKGLDVLIEAVNTVSKTHKNFKLIIAGSCEDFQQYRSMINDPGLFDLRISLIPNDQIESLFNEADFLILPYFDVTQSGPVLVAYNYGLPVIASDLPGFSETIINDQTGFLFKNRSSASLANCLLKVINMSPEDRQKIRKNLADYISRAYNITDHISKYNTMFNSLLT